MTTTAYRIVKKKRVNSAFDGDGARLFPGRWNSRGTPIVYTASSQALAILEIYVHCESEDLIHDQFVTIPISIASDCILALDNSLPEDWNTHPASASTRIIGDNWVAENASVVLAVPSVVAPLERNYLLNPNHPDFKKIIIKEPIPFNFDQRLKEK